MKQGHVLAIAVVCLLLGFSLGLSAKDSPAGGIGLFRGKPPKEAAQAALVEAERLAENGSWELIGVGRLGDGDDIFFG